MREKIVNMIMEMKFSINKYSEVSYRVGPVYRGLSKFVIVDQYVGFPREGYNFSVADVEFHTVRNATTLYRVNVRPKYIAVLRCNGSVNVTASHMSLKNTLKSRGPRTSS
jgi:hypothetical protein